MLSIKFKLRDVPNIEIARTNKASKVNDLFENAIFYLTGRITSYRVFKFNYLRFKKVKSNSPGIITFSYVYRDCQIKCQRLRGISKNNKIIFIHN